MTMQHLVNERLTCTKDVRWFALILEDHRRRRAAISTLHQRGGDHLLAKIVGLAALPGPPQVSAEASRPRATVIHRWSHRPIGHGTGTPRRGLLQLPGPGRVRPAVHAGDWLPASGVVRVAM